MTKSTILLFMWVYPISLVFGQKTFTGTFLMSFKTSAETNTDFPMLWNIEPPSAGGRMAMEIQDDMLKKGVSKRVVFAPADSSWTMMISFNSVKQGTRIRAAAMFRDTAKHTEPKIKTTEETKEIAGYNCKKLIMESENYLAEVWTTNEIKYNLCFVYRLLSHCGMMNGYIRKGDWFQKKKFKGMVMEVTSTKKNSGEMYTMSISNVVLNQIDSTLFRSDGFKISDIPEGLNCGAEMEK